MLPFPTPMQLGQGRLDVDKVFATTLTSAANNTAIPLNFAPNFDWHKLRATTADNYLADSLRGDNYLVSNSTNNQFSIGSGKAPNGVKKETKKEGTGSEVIWSFRFAKKFFDVVTYTGDGVDGRQIAHNLGIKPGLIIIKCLSAARNWSVSFFTPSTPYLGGYLNTTASLGSSSPTDGNATATSAIFQLNRATSLDAINEDRREYVAYLFAHDPSPNGIIQCGTYIGNSSTNGPIINLGWQPQWLLIKKVGTSDWNLYDSKRSTANPRNTTLAANNSDGETTSAAANLDFISSGFQIKTTSAAFNSSGNTFIYMAIRKGKL